MSETYQSSATEIFDFVRFVVDVDEVAFFVAEELAVEGDVAFAAADVADYTEGVVILLVNDI